MKDNIEIKLGQLEAIISSLSNIITKEIPIKVSYKFSKVLRNITSEHEVMISKKREIIEKYADRDGDGNLIERDGRVEILDMHSFERDINELMDIIFYVDFEKISINDLSDINISIQDLYNLDMFFIE